jgi:hypothetical protein
MLQADKEILGAAIRLGYLTYGKEPSDLTGPETALLHQACILGSESAPTLSFIFMLPEPGEEGRDQAGLALVLGRERCLACLTPCKITRMIPYCTVCHLEIANMFKDELRIRVKIGERERGKITELLGWMGDLPLRKGNEPCVRCGKVVSLWGSPRWFGLRAICYPCAAGEATQRGIIGELEELVGGVDWC